MKKLKVLTVVLGMVCALCLVGCKNAAEDSGSGGSTPTGVQITSEAELNAFLAGSETKGVITQGFTLTNHVLFSNTSGGSKTIDLYGKTVDVGKYSIVIMSGELTLCDSSATAGTITNNGANSASNGQDRDLIINQGTLSIKDGINIVLSGSFDSSDSFVGLANVGATIPELNANITVTNSSTSTTGETSAVSIGRNNGVIQSITGGTYSATGASSAGTVYGIRTGAGAGAVNAIASGVTFTAAGPGTLKNRIQGTTASQYPNVTFNPKLNE